VIEKLQENLRQTDPNATLNRVIRVPPSWPHGCGASEAWPSPPSSGRGPA